MRHAYEVISEIKKKIPDFIKHDQERLKSLIDSARYQAPESQWIWTEIANFVNDLIPFPPIKDWHKEIANILLNEKKY